MAMMLQGQRMMKKKKKMKRAEAQLKEEPNNV